MDDSQGDKNKTGQRAGAENSDPNTSMQFPLYYFLPLVRTQSLLQGSRSLYKFDEERLIFHHQILLYNKH